MDLEHRDEVIESEIHISSNNEVTGFRRSNEWATDQYVYFVAQFSKEFNKATIAQNDTPDNSEENFDAIAIAPDGSVWVSGEEDESIFIAHYPDDENGAINKRTIGNAGDDKITDLAVDNDGNVYATGFSNVPFLNVGSLQTHRGNRDAFAFKLPINGGFIYRTFLGTTEDDKGFGITVNPATGEAYVAGRTTGTLDGEASSGRKDNFVIKLISVKNAG